MCDALSFQQERARMVSEQIERRGIRNERLLEALRRVPRHCFVPPHLTSQAYEDGPLPIGNGQTISQPYIVALMTSLLGLEGHENVLEIGTGSGYQAAILAEMVKTVHTIERHPELADCAMRILGGLGYQNIEVHIGDGSTGWPNAAPYQAIMVTAAAPRPPDPVLKQLAKGGRLVIPVGDRYGQDLQLWSYDGDFLSPENIIPVAFVPLRGEHGWRDEEWQDRPFPFK
jgi:protein-L-isoaspartate(D-aspartate) O-methyltransferase